MAPALAEPAGFAVAVQATAVRSVEVATLAAASQGCAASGLRRRVRHSPRPGHVCVPADLA